METEISVPYELRLLLCPCGGYRKLIFRDSTFQRVPNWGHQNVNML